MKKLSARLWLTLILIGLVGQFAWTIENMYFNVFLYNTISTDPGYISAMVGWSAAAATLTTLLMGALSDRVGKRKLFICGGYLLWGVSTAAFGFVTVENAAKLFPAHAVAAAAMMVVVLDCVMTFFGSTANDAAFNAYITDAVSEADRGKTESVLAILPLISMLVIFGAFDGMTQRGEWRKFFAIFGGLVTLTGLVGCFLIEEPKLQPCKEPYLRNLVYGLRPRSCGAHPALYLALAAFCVFSVAVQTFFPYLIIYIQNYLKIEGYAIVLGVVLIVASAVSVLFGRVIDRVGPLRFTLPAALVMFVGLIGMFFCTWVLTVILAGCVMMSGYMLVTAALSGEIRDRTPEGKAGHFQGIRMIFGVLLPMILGPALGAAVIRNSDSTYVELGVVKTVPTPGIFLAAAVVLLLLVPFVLTLHKQEGNIMPELKTVWGENLNPEAILPEYPRPQLVRNSYVNLNGRWDYAITASDAEPEYWDGEILVPFSPEAPLSGVNRTLLPGQTLWYRREIAEMRREGQRLLLHFGAVDQEAKIYVNGKLAGAHLGGYTAFTVELTEFLTDGPSVLTVAVRDGTDTNEYCRGKQKTKRGGIWYTPQSGIWQTVWMEWVPQSYITGLRITPDAANGCVRVVVQAEENRACYLHFAGRRVGAFTNRECVLRVEAPELWTPEHPKLYEFSAELGEDRVESYFALRDVGIGRDAAGHPCLTLNGRPVFHAGVLDQGYWPDALYTAPSDEALVWDIRTMKNLGFNMLRKHIKVEPMRWYYHCDRLGMLVWQDMPSGGGKYDLLTISAPLITRRHKKDSDYKRFARTDAAGRAEYYAGLDEMVRQLYNCPSVVMWVPFNEGWGQFDAAEAVRRIRALDQTRTIDHASGWHDQGAGDVQSLHVYFYQYRFRPDKRGRAVVLSEFGGYNLPLAGHTWNDANFGYRGYKTPEALEAAYRKLYETQIIPAKEKGLAACVYTQLSDVEDEVNGLVTYDRRVVKLPVSAPFALNAQLKRE